MKKITSIIYLLLAISAVSCVSTDKKPSALSLRYSGNTVPAGMIGKWSLDTAASTLNQLSITASGADCFMCNPIAAENGSGLLKATGITWFDTGSCDACGSFTFYPVNGSVRQSNTTQERTATEKELNSFQQQYSYTIVDGVIKISSEDSVYKERPITRLTE